MSKSSGSLFVLCQDCEQVLPYTLERHQEKELCACGGQFCGCTECSRQAEERVFTPDLLNSSFVKKVASQSMS